MSKEKVTRLSATKVPDTDLGTVTLSQRYESVYNGTIFELGETYKVGKMMVSPTGIRYYKVFGTIEWLSDHQVCNVNVNNIPKLRAVKIYSA